MRRTTSRTGIDSSTAAVPMITAHWSHTAPPSCSALTPTESVDSRKK